MGRLEMNGVESKDDFTLAHDGRVIVAIEALPDLK
jgi:hypothetical protein